MESDKNAFTVTLGAFSGRPNPVLSLSGDVLKQFAELVKSSIGKEPANPPPPPSLGFYYGFFVQAPVALARQSGLPEQFSIYKGVLTVSHGREQKHWRDTSNIERFLLREARASGHGGLLETLGVPNADSPGATAP